MLRQPLHLYLSLLLKQLPLSLSLQVFALGLVLSCLPCPVTFRCCFSWCSLCSLFSSPNPQAVPWLLVAFVLLGSHYYRWFQKKIILPKIGTYIHFQTIPFNLHLVFVDHILVINHSWVWNRHLRLHTFPIDLITFLKIKNKKCPPPQRLSNLFT